MAVVPNPLTKPATKPATKKPKTGVAALPKNVSPGKIGADDVARLNIYIARLKRATKAAPPAQGTKARDVYDARVKKLGEYTTRKSRFRVALGDTAAKRKTQPGTQK
jgi:hypothetical protein